MRNAILAVLVVLAVFALAVSGAAAHGSNETDTSHEDAPGDDSADAWGTWMEQHMIEHMGEERAAQMEVEHMGEERAAQMEERMPMTYEEMGQHMASHDDSSDRGMMGDMAGMGCH